MGPNQVTTLKRKCDREPRLIDVEPDGWWSLPNFERRTLDVAHEVEDATVLHPDLVVEESAQLLGDPADSSLSAFSGFRPVVVNASHASVGLDLIEGGDPVEQLRQLALAGLGEEEVIESLEALSLIGMRDLRAAAHEISEQRPLAAVPSSDLLACRSIEPSEVLLYLPEIGQQFTPST